MKSVSEYTMEDEDFKSALRNLVLEAFASGETVDGTWELDSVPDEIPDWEITIERLPDHRTIEAVAEQVDEQIV